MSSKRDLVEAHGFNRRRLVSAFVSGAPGGREVEPVRYGRTLVGGLVLALLILAGAAVSGFLKPTVPDDWNQKSLVIGKTSGSRFVAYKGTLYPVINTTSARLILATDGKLNVDFVPEDKIAGARPGDTIGIPGAPDIVPSAGRLLGTGWSACTNQQQGIKVRVSGRAAVAEAPRSVFVVRSRGRVWVVSGRRRYPLPAGRVGETTLRALKLDGEPIRPVPGQWLDLLSVGSPLRPFSVAGQGRVVRTGVAGLDRVGAPVRVDGRPFVLDAGGNLRELSQFAATLYGSVGPGASRGLEVSGSDVSGLDTVNDPAKQPYPDDWPVDSVSPYTSPESPCLLLHARSGAAPYSTLATPGRDSSAVPTGSNTTSVVEAGRGALVRGSTGGVLGSGSVFLVDSTGTRYAIGPKGGEAAALTALGYHDLDPTPVPRAWLGLFTDGPALSAAAAAQATGTREQ